MDARFLMTVHDENDISSPIDKVKENTEAIKEAMEKMEGFDVPFVAEVEYGYDWHNMSKELT
jgi:DNA polymerase I-like protein with 3'-5' exonuclease and polymerase domains